MSAPPEIECPFCESGDPFKSPAGSERFHVVPVGDGHTYARCLSDHGSAPAPEKGKPCPNCFGERVEPGPDGEPIFCQVCGPERFTEAEAGLLTRATSAGVFSGGAPEKEPEPPAPLSSIRGLFKDVPEWAGKTSEEIIAERWAGQSAGEPERAGARLLAAIWHDTGNRKPQCRACYQYQDEQHTSGCWVGIALRGAAPSAPEGQECEVCEAQGRKPAADNFGWFICQEHHMDALKRERVEGFDEGRESSEPEGQEIRRLREALRGIAEADPDAPEVESWKWLARKFMADAKRALEGR